ncbi:MAG TPA: hypothetical protein VGC66_08740 [Pyrinomonadaceae bacterium]|jgi:hypothetical protein
MTTPEEHNKYLAYSHLGYAAFQLLTMLVMVVFSFIILDWVAASDTKGEMPIGFIAAVLIVSFLFHLLFTVPSLIAGFGLLKRRHWAKTASLVAGVMSAMSFPIGTAVCVYTFWFLLGESGKDFYTRQLAETGSRSDYFLNEPSGANTAGRWQERKQEYVPPREMPNWRD